MYGLEVKIGYYIKIVGASELEGKLFQITGEEPLRYITGDEDTAYYSSVASGAESGYKNIEVLEPDKTPKHLAQVRWGVRSGGKYFFKLPTGTNRFGVDRAKAIGYITNDISPYVKPNDVYMFWLVNNFYPAIGFTNTTLFAVTPKIWFEGTKYDIIEVTGATKIDVESKKLFTFITIGGIRGSS